MSKLQTVHGYIEGYYPIAIVTDYGRALTNYSKINGIERSKAVIEINTTTLIAVAGVIGALATIVGFGYKIFKWFEKQEEQTKQIEAIKQEEKEHRQELNNELCLLTYAVLACLKGLQEQGCNGPVSEAIQKVEKHINQKAHGQD